LHKENFAKRIWFYISICVKNTNYVIKSAMAALFRAFYYVMHQ